MIPITMKKQLSIIICTRNRSDHLLRAISSIVEAIKRHEIDAVEVLIIDDGRLPNSLLEYLSNMLKRVSIDFEYINKSDRPGLFDSRLEGIRKARYDTLLFIDDDVVIEPDYIKYLFDTYEAFPSAAGVGGIDLLTKPAPLWRRILEILIFYRSVARGKLSISGFGGSMDTWTTATFPFQTEFLSGCNMSFRRAAVKDVTKQEWLRSYSLGEDIYLSYFAQQTGPLFVNPNMKVRHYRTSASRDLAKAVAYSKIINHYELLLKRDAPWYCYCALFITAIGIILQHLIRAFLMRRSGAFAELLGTIQGLLEVLRRSVKMCLR